MGHATGLVAGEPAHLKRPLADGGDPPAVHIVQRWVAEPRHDLELCRVHEADDLALVTDEHHAL